MEDLQKQLLELEDEENKFTLYKRVEKVLSKIRVWGFGTTFLLIQISIYICLYYYYHFKELFEYIVAFIYIASAALILTAIIWGIFYFILRRVILLYYRINNNSFNLFEKDFEELNRKKKVIELELKRTAEKEFSQRLWDILKLLNNDSNLSLEQAFLKIKVLEEDYDKIKKGGLLINTKGHYDYYINQIKELSYTKSLKESSTTTESKHLKNEELAKQSIDSKTYSTDLLASSTKDVNDKPSLATDKKSNFVFPEVKLPGTKNGIENPLDSEAHNLFSSNNKTAGNRGFFSFKRKLKINYQELNELRSNIGELGESFVLEYEKLRLEKGNQKFLIPKLKRVSIEDDSLGYDIISFDEYGNRRHIEVKTTTQDKNSPFFISSNELNAMKTLENFFIYRVYNFDIEKKKGEVIIIDCKSDFIKNFDVQACTYQVSPKLDK